MGLTTDRLHASELAAVLGLSPWASEWDVFARLKGLREDQDRPELRRGRYLERAVVDWWADTHGQGFAVQDPTLYFGQPMPLAGPFPLCGTPDRIAVRNTDPLDGSNGAAEGIEAKTSRTREGWGEEGTDQVPVFYGVQIQIYLGITGLDVWHLPVYFTLADAFAAYRLESNGRIFDELQRRGREWFRKHIELGEEPDPDGSEGCSEAIAAMFPRPKSDLRLASVEEAELIGQIHRMKADIKGYQSQLDHAENRLKLAIGEAEGLRYGQMRATWKAQQSTTIDPKALRAELPEVAKRFERTREFRVLRVSVKEE